jgi:CO/xanthine dehydrogenase FAD-binding subunit
MDSGIRPLPKFNYVAPHSLNEALGLLQEHEEKARLIAGGTDLLVWMKQGVVYPGMLIDIRALPELSFIRVRGDELHIGAATPMNEIKDSREVQERAPGLVQALQVLACHPIRNTATVGGNLCSASPAADTAPPLLALGASVALQSVEGERRVALSGFFAGPGLTQKKPNEILKHIIVPHQAGRSGFLKLGRRKALTLSIASVAACVTIQDGKFTDAKVALGAVAPIPLLCKKAQEQLIGARVGEDVIQRASEAAKKEVSPITDVRATAAYRREMAGVLTRRILRNLAMGKGKDS